MDQTVLSEVINFLLVVVIMTITRYLIPYIKSRVDSSKLDNLMVWAKEAVLAAEQIYNIEKSGDDKKNYVTNRIVEIAEKAGMKLNGSEVELLIEAVVKQMNDTSKLSD